MNKNTLEIIIVTIAFMAGITLSITHNPLLGVVVLLSVLTSISFISKFLAPKSAELLSEAKHS